MKNEILFIGATHGNERVGVDAIALTQQTYKDFDWIIGNPRAFTKNIRFTKTDLNRCGRGNPQSSIYEEKRAVEIQNIAKNYKYIIDIHGTYQDTGTFLLVTNPTKENLRLASFFNINTLIIWPSVTPDMQYPLSEFFSCGIEIEVGNQTDPQNTQLLVESIQDFFENLPANERLDEEQWTSRLYNKKIYEMYGDIQKSTGLTLNMLQEKTEITWQGETFTPIFIGTYPYDTILGYKLKSLTPKDLQKKFLS